jgi:hypothetical protein
MTWWLVTWSTHGSWLPGDPRGFQTRRGKEYVPPPARYAKPGEKIYDPAQYAGRYLAAKLETPNAVTLGEPVRQRVLDAAVKQIGKLPLVPAALAVSGQHCHLLAKFGSLRIRTTVGVLKGEATKALRKSGFDEEDIWGAECHMKSKRDGREFQIALRYVAKHIDEGAAVFIWNDFRGLLEQH